MNIPAIHAHLRYLLPNRTTVLRQETASGPALGIRVNANQIVWALVPIDDESDEQFARFLVSEWHKALSVVAGSLVHHYANPNALR